MSSVLTGWPVSCLVQSVMWAQTSWMSRAKLPQAEKTHIFLWHYKTSESVCNAKFAFMDGGVKDYGKKDYESVCDL